MGSTRVTDRQTTDRQTDRRATAYRERERSRSLNTVRPMLSDRCLSCPLSVLSLTLVYCGQTVGWIKMPLGIGLGPATLCVYSDPAPPKGPHPQFSAHVCCGQTAGWIKMPLGTEVGLGQGDIVLDGCLLYTSPSPRDRTRSRMPSSA